MSAGNDSKLPALNVKGVTLTEKNTKIKTDCLSSTLIFAGKLANLAQLNNKVLTCTNEQLIDTVVMSLPGWLAITCNSHVQLPRPLGSGM